MEPAKTPTNRWMASITPIWDGSNNTTAAVAAESDNASVDDDDDDLDSDSKKEAVNLSHKKEI